MLQDDLENSESLVRGLLRRLTNSDEARADDLAQETFIKVYRSLSGFSGRARFASWVYRIAYNTFLNDQRGRRAEISKASQPASQTSRAAPDFQLDVDRALSRLSADQRLMLDLHYKLGMTHTEIAETLSEPLGTVKSRLLRGRAEIKILLAEWYHHE